MAKLVYLVQDLLFVSKIRETARQLGIEAEAARDLDELARAAEGAQLAIVDLRRPDALSALGRLPDGVKRVGFIDHERTDVMEAARALGCVALAKGKFSTELPRLLADL